MNIFILMTADEDSVVGAFKSSKSAWDYARKNYFWCNQEELEEMFYIVVEILRD